ncbi:AraC family transcriptional regulator [Niameybacter massiliensis]|uniref:AraC family transcriptional regulator n=1 Tax=Niameybacter massiliensis TaxID=1658108 RepID=UPI0006B6583D|nr:helix-turn-helix domain-containing protein [Niameybacter massiliensis]
MKGRRLSFHYNKYIIQLLIYLIIIAAVPLAIVSGSTFIGTKKIILSQVEEFSKTYLKQAITAVDIVFKQVSDSCKQMTIDDTFGDFENFYRGGYYEELIRTMNITEDLDGINSYVESRSKIFKRMSALRLSNEFVESVYLLDGRKGIVYTDVGTQYDKEEFIDPMWLKYEKEDFVAPEFMNTRIAKQSDGTSKAIITLVMHSYYESNNIIAVNLDAQKLYYKIRSINNGDNDLLFVLAPNGEVLLQDERYQKVLEEINIDNLENHMIKVQKIDNVPYIITVQDSGYTNWRFVNAVNLEKYLRYIFKLAFLIIVLSSICIAIILVAAVIFANKLYKPVKKVLQYIGHYRKESKDNEFDSIQNSFITIQGETDVLKQKLDYTLPACKEKFLLSLLKYKHTTKEEISKQLQLLDIKLDIEGIVIIILSAQTSKELVELNVLGTRKILVGEIIQDTLNDIRYENLEVENDKWVLLINLDNRPEHEVFKRLECLSKHLEAELMIQPIIAVSRCLTCITEVQEEFEEVSQFFKYLVVNNKVGVSGLRESQLSTSKNIIYPKEKLDILGGYLRNGDLDSTKRTFEQILAEGTLEQEKISYEQAQLIYFEVLSQVFNTVTSMGLEISQVYGVNRNLYQELIDHYNTGAINCWFNEIFQVATNYIDEGIIDHKNKYVSYIIKEIEESCGSAISLDKFAEDLGLNPTYISRVFKEVTGKKFIDYLTKVRIDHSIQLLADEKYKIKDIAMEVGYPNTNYFIKVFKEYYSITPGEYRKINGNKKIE